MATIGNYGHAQERIIAEGIAELQEMKEELEKKLDAAIEYNPNGEMVREVTEHLSCIRRRRQGSHVSDVCGGAGLPGHSDSLVWR